MTTAFTPNLNLGKPQINVDTDWPTQLNADMDKIDALVGAWTAVSYSAGNFTANGAMTWTVDAGDVQVFTYRIIGKTLFINFRAQTTSVGGTLNTQLRVAIPGGFTIKTNGLAMAFVIDNGNRNVGYYNADLANGSTFFTIERADGANWSAATNTTSLYGQVYFEIN